MGYEYDEPRIWDRNRRVDKVVWPLSGNKEGGVELANEEAVRQGVQGEGRYRGPDRSTAEYSVMKAATFIVPPHLGQIIGSTS